jgi:two-component system, OmpR family, response regulator
MSVLIIDDEQGLRQTVSLILGEEGYEVHAASDGEEGLRRALDLNPSLILCDVRMPGMDGRALYTRLEREAPAAARTLTFMTGDVLAEETREFLERLGRPTLVKPFGRAQLLRLIASLRPRRS